MSFEPYAQAIVEFVRQHNQWAAPIVFLLAFGESLAFISLILPSTVILVAIAGLLGASGSSISFVPIWLAAGIGGSLGYALSYWIGLYFKNDIDKVWPFTTRPHLLLQGRTFFERWGIFGVFLGHFFGPVRAVIPVIAGTMAMKQLPFQIANVSSAFLWAAGVLAPAMYGGQWLFG